MITANNVLLKNIRERQKRHTPFGYGILTADRWTENMEKCSGSDVCYRYAANGSVSWSDIKQKSAKTLTYSNEDMVVEDMYEKAVKNRRLQIGQKEIELPKNTLMVFRHVLTTPRKDRDNDILRTKGAIVDPKMLLLWQHVHTLPIGKMLGVAEHTDDKLSLYSALVDINELAKDAAVMIANDMGRFSHGFRALEFRKVKAKEQHQQGYDVQTFEIMEESLVSVPSNADAGMEEILLDLVEGGKLTSAVMKETGKHIRMKRPLMIGVIDAISEPSTKTCGCGCGGTGGCTSEKENEKAGDEGGTDDKEMMKCPKCGSPMEKGGTCKCGYKAEDKTQETPKNDEDGGKGAENLKPKEDPKEPKEKEEEYEQDKEEKCPECGGKMKDGVCSKCGYKKDKGFDDSEDLSVCPKCGFFDTKDSFAKRSQTFKEITVEAAFATFIAKGTPADYEKMVKTIHSLVLVDKQKEITKSFQALMKTP